MLTSEPAGLAELGTGTGPLTETNDPAPDVAVDGVVGSDAGGLTSSSVLAASGTIPLGVPWPADVGASTLTSVPVG